MEHDVHHGGTESYNIYMTEVERISDQLRRSFEGHAWHGASLMESLKGVTWEHASRRPINEAHTIFELILHTHMWQAVALAALNGKTIVPSDEEDWPKSKRDEKAWKRALEEMQKTHNELMETLAQFPDSKLEMVLPGKDWTVYQILYGMIQHNISHAGQICLLKKGWSVTRNDPG